MPRFAEGAFEANLATVELVREIATAHDAAPGQVALAWLLAKSPWAVPVPGTLRISRMEENCAAAAFTLTDGEIARLDEVTVSGDKEIALGHSWFDGVTPQPRSS